MSTGSFVWNLAGAAVFFILFLKTRQTHKGLGTTCLMLAVGNILYILAIALM